MKNKLLLFVLIVPFITSCAPKGALSDTFVAKGKYENNIFSSYFEEDTNYPNIEIKRKDNNGAIDKILPGDKLEVYKDENGDVVDLRLDETYVSTFSYEPTPGVPGYRNFNFKENPNIYVVGNPIYVINEDFTYADFYFAMDDEFYGTFYKNEKDSYTITAIYSFNPREYKTISDVSSL